MSSKGDRRVFAFIEAVEQIAGSEVSKTVPTLPPDAVSELARRIALSICARHARTHLYVPVAIEMLQNGPRNRQIWDAYKQPGPDGARPYSLARVAQISDQHRLTVRQVHAILKQMRELEVVARQVALPGFEGPS